jgi:hypothetical protein
MKLLDAQQMTGRDASIIFNGKTCCLSIRSNSLCDLKSLLQSVLNSKTDVLIKYQDQDDDWIVITCDDDMHDMLKLPSIKLQVNERPILSQNCYLQSSGPIVNIVPSKPRSVLKFTANSASSRNSSSVMERKGDTKISRNPVMLETVELDAHLLAADERRLQNRAYESSATRINRFNADTAIAGGPFRVTSRIRWGDSGRSIDCPQQVATVSRYVHPTCPPAISTTPGFGPEAQRRIAPEVPSWSLTAVGGGGAPAPPARPYYDAVTSPPASSSSRVIPNPPSTGTAVNDADLCGLGLSLDPKGLGGAGPFRVLNGCKLRDCTGSPACTGITPKPGDWCAAAAAAASV